MRRRRYLELAAYTSPLIAGCASNPGQAPTSGQQVQSGVPTSRNVRTPTQTDTESSTPTESPRQNPNTIFVDSSEGSEHGTGEIEAPLHSIQAALRAAKPGTTIEVATGVYEERIQPPHGGEPEAPITITGPPDAVLKSHPERYNVVLIRRSHIHIKGLTIDGLEDPDRPDEVESYSRAQLVQTRPPVDTDEYLEDIVVAPHRIGNSQKSLVSLERTRNAEVGPFRVIGLAGADYTVGDEIDHNGEIIYLGTAPANLGKKWHPWEDPDRSSNVHIHHIDNSAGHAHGDFVDVKPGTQGNKIEYCTDRNGGLSSDDSNTVAIALAGRDNIVRYCDIARTPIPVAFDATDADDMSLQNDVYYNRFSKYTDKAIAFLGRTNRAEQGIICGNLIDGPSEGQPSSDCPSDVPTGDGVGHLGGDSPWRES